MPTQRRASAFSASSSTLPSPPLSVVRLRVDNAAVPRAFEEAVARAVALTPPSALLTGYAWSASARIGRVVALVHGSRVRAELFVTDLVEALGFAYVAASFEVFSVTHPRVLDAARSAVALAQAADEDPFPVLLRAGEVWGTLVAGAPPAWGWP